MELILKGEPRSTNHVWKHSCSRGFLHSYMTPEGKALKESYQWQARSQFHGKPLSCPLVVTVAIYRSTRRKLDIDNAGLKLLFDAMNGLVWEDDVQIEEMTVMKRFDKENPRIELSVTPLNG